MDKIKYLNDLKKVVLDAQLLCINSMINNAFYFLKLIRSEEACRLCLASIAANFKRNIMIPRQAGTVALGYAKGLHRF